MMDVTCNAQQSKNLLIQMFYAVVCTQIHQTQKYIVLFIGAPPNHMDKEKTSMSVGFPGQESD